MSVSSCAFFPTCQRSWSSLDIPRTRTSDSGTFKLEWLSGREIGTFCGGSNCDVDMKKMSSRKATSTIGVMSILIPIRFIFFAAMLLRRFLDGEHLDHFQGRLVHHVVEVVDHR